MAELRFKNRFCCGSVKNIKYMNTNFGVRLKIIYLKTYRNFVKLDKFLRDSWHKKYSNRQRDKHKSYGNNIDKQNFSSKKKRIGTEFEYYIGII